MKGVGIDVAGIKANDWYVRGPEPCTSGKAEYIGAVYYIDNMKEDDLPKTWSDDYAPAGGLRAIKTEGNKTEIDALLKKFEGTTVGLAEHSITVTWSIDAKATKVSSKAPA